MKKRILYINSVCGFGSTGNIVVDLAESKECDSLVCFGRKKDYAGVNSYKFTSIFDNCLGALRTILFDNNLNICSRATKRLIKKIKEFNPDIIHLHNLHGYYVNVEMLFEFLKEYKKSVVWTLHDCWSITGYCPHFDYINCGKYKTKCSNCPYGFSYPFSLFKQSVEKEYKKKKELFNSIDNLTIITPSDWLKRKIEDSYLTKAKVYVINNGIDVEEQNKKKNVEFTILAVSNYWTKEKGKDELKKIIPLLDKDIQVTIIGDLKDKDPIYKRCTLIKRINNHEELLKEYAKAHVLINPTLQDSFPTVNIESLKCGTPVITYNTGGSVEPITKDTGLVIEKYNHILFAKTINELKNNYTYNSDVIKEFAKKYSKEEMIDKYKKIYDNLINEA